MVSLLVCDQWLPRTLLDAVDGLTRAHFAYGHRAPDTPEFSWYSPKQGRHVSRLPLPCLDVIEAYVENLILRLGPLLDCEPEGYEWWGNHGNTLPWHVDRDERLFRESATLRHPLWSTVLYTNVSIRGAGGELVVLSDETQTPPYTPDASGREIPQKHHSISPRSNRLVVFPRGVCHRVDPFAGERSSLAMNLWDTTPVDFLAHAGSRYCHALR